MIFPKGGLIMTANEIATFCKDIILALAALATACIAYNGLSTWKKELKGKSEYTLAKEVLRAIYQVREGFKHVRDPLMSGYEYPKDTIGPNGMLIPEKEYEAFSHAYDKRWEVLKNALMELEEKHIEAQVEWGPENQAKIIGIRKCAKQLQFIIWDFLERKRKPDQERWRQENTDPKEITKYDRKQTSILYDHGPENEFTQQINSAVIEFEEWLRPKVK